jgi:hypothetical protein
MSTIILALYLLLVGLMAIITVNIPHWVAGCLAIAAALALLYERGPWRKSGP